MLAGLALAGGAAALLIGRSLRSTGSGAWAALLLLGQAAALRWIEAGPAVAYQHFEPSAIVRDPLALAVVLVQLALVTAGIARHGRRVRAWLRAVPAWKLVAAAAIAAAVAAAPSRDLGLYALEVPCVVALQALALANAALVVLALPRARRDRLGGLRTDVSAAAASSAPCGGGDRFALALSAAVVAVCALLAVGVYERHPHVPDEVAYLLHARYFAAGTIGMPAPPVPEAFDVDLMDTRDGLWFSPVPPGWPAVLSVGVRAGVPWLVNPLLAGLGILLCFAVGRRLYGSMTARIATVLLAVSPWYLLIGMSFMPHLTTVVFALGSALAVLRWRESRRFGWLLAGGILAGGVALTRPLEAVAVAGVLGLAVLWIARRDRWFTSGLAYGGAALLLAASLLPYNERLTGSPHRFPIMAYADARYGPGSNALGFGPEKGLGWSGLDPFPGHGLADAAVNAVLNTHAIDVELFGWASGAAFLLVLALLRRPSGADPWVLAAVGVPVFLHTFYWFAGGPDFGARYWFLVIAPLVLLVARWLTTGGPARRTGALLGAAALSWAALWTFMPWRAVDKYWQYRGMQPGIRELAASGELHDALVLVRGRRHPDYASAAVYNPLDFSGPGPVFAWYREEHVRPLLEAAFPERRVVVVEGPSVTGRGYRIVEGSGIER